MIRDFLDKKKIIAVLGTGQRLIRKIERQLKELNKTIDFILDCDYALSGTSFERYPIYSLEMLEQHKGEDFLLIISPSVQAHSMLRAYGMKYNQDYITADDLVFPRDISCKYERNVYAPWLADEEFIRIYACICKYTLVDIARCYELTTLLRQMAQLPGNILEVGVWRGGTGFLLTHYAQKFRKKVYLADTFAGVVKVNKSKDLTYINGAHDDTSIETVENLFNHYNYKNYEILCGIFPDETGCSIETEEISFCHIDVDVYESAKAVTEWVWNKMPIGGIIVYDDYGFRDCNGVTEYVNEVSCKEDRLFIYNINGHGISVKLS